MLESGFDRWKARSTGEGWRRIWVEIGSSDGQHPAELESRLYRKTTGSCSYCAIPPCDLALAASLLSHPVQSSRCSEERATRRSDAEENRELVRHMYDPAPGKRHRHFRAMTQARPSSSSRAPASVPSPASSKSLISLASCRSWLCSRQQIARESVVSGRQSHRTVAYQRHRLSH